MKGPLLGALAAALLFSAVAQAKMVAGVELPLRINLGETELALSSCGVRDTLWIDHYVAALYVPPGQTAQAAVRDPQAAKLLLVTIVTAQHFPEQLPQKWREPLQASLAVDKFSLIDAAYKRLRHGDTMLFAYVPDAGLTMKVNGHMIVESGHGVIDALLRAWEKSEDSGTLGKLLRGHDC